MFSFLDAISMVENYEYKLRNSPFHNIFGMIMTAINCLSAILTDEEKLRFAVYFKLFCNEKFWKSNENWKQNWVIIYFHFRQYYFNAKLSTNLEIEFINQLDNVRTYYELQNKPQIVDSNEVAYKGLITLMSNYLDLEKK